MEINWRVCVFGAATVTATGVLLWEAWRRWSECRQVQHAQAAELAAENEWRAAVDEWTHRRADLPPRLREAIAADADHVWARRRTLLVRAIASEAAAVAAAKIVTRPSNAATSTTTTTSATATPPAAAPAIGADTALAAACAPRSSAVVVTLPAAAAAAAPSDQQPAASTAAAACEGKANAGAIWTPKLDASALRRRSSVMMTRGGLYTHRQQQPQQPSLECVHPPRPTPVTVADQWSRLARASDAYAVFLHRVTGALWAVNLDPMSTADYFEVYADEAAFQEGRARLQERVSWDGSLVRRYVAPTVSSSMTTAA